MSENPEAFMERVRARRRPHHPEAYIAELERELEERLRVNVGLVIENRELRSVAHGRRDDSSSSA